MQRSRGSASATFTRRSGQTRLDGLHQSGCAKAMLPRTHEPCPEVVFLNTSGGITGGDRLRYALDLGPGTQVVAATQTAERAYRSPAGAGEVDLAFALGAGARLDWLPQETILFDGSDTRRSTRIDMHADSTLLWAEMLVMGRAAMGETLNTINLLDRREVMRAGKPVFVEPFRLSPANLTAQAGLSGARAISTVAFLAPAAKDALEPVRALSFDGVQMAASAWDGKLIIRARAPDAQPLKKAVAALVTTLRRGAALPRVWQV
ncbi:MAG: urease accessory protein UreD [Dinoroseobacter sp.]|nr:urease accessory protein UreD [Dinoroseobacter sp.]